MDQGASPCAPAPCRPQGGRLSYKFQRLREQIRESIVQGEFKGQLPGERDLGRRFRANAKTINKALCDLASEGLLVRIIGRGTFVAEAEGQCGHLQGPQTFHMIVPAVKEPPPHRRAMIEALTEALGCMGHQLDCIAHAGHEQRGAIPAAAWPTIRRRFAAGVVAYPHTPLGDVSGHLSDELIAEAWRRHLPVVILGGVSSTAKVNAVLPDYVSAGFSLAEHLFMLGCERVAILRDRAEGREADMAISGCQTAAMRHRRGTVSYTLEGGADWVGGLMGDSSPAAQAAGPAVGLLCVGAQALAAARSDRAIGALIARGALAVSCVLEPGDHAAGDAGVTSYEFDLRRIAAWAARLLTESRPGQRPVEVMVPGELMLRGAGVPRKGGNGHHVGSLQSRVAMAEAVI